MHKPLTGIKILDLSRLLPGPLATQMLADMGADVIKVEDISSPDYIRFFPPFIGDDSALYLSLNRNKKSILLNLKADEGKELFLSLVKTADVVIEQYRPGVLDKIGIGYEKAKTLNPKIIYVSVTGYGQTGPYAQRAGHDLNYISIAGVLANTGTKEKPVIPGVQLADVSGSYATVNGCLAALLHCQRTGEGQHVDVSMTDAVMPFATLINATAWADGRNIERGNFQLSGALANYNVYECGDGKFIALGALEPKFWMTFCDAVNKPEWKNKIIAPEEEVTELKKEVSALFRSKTRDEWEAFSARHDVCLTPVLETHELDKNAQLQNRKMVHEINTGTDKNFKTIGSAVKFPATAFQGPALAPKQGSDTDNILRGIGYSEEQIREMRKVGVVK